MKFIFSVFILIIIGYTLMGQTRDENIQGTVTYITTQSVYVKFPSTEKINIGDTLYIKQDGQLLPVLLITNLSSISCVCNPISANTLKVNDIIFTKTKSAVIQDEIAKPNQEIIPIPVEEMKDTLTELVPKVKQDIYGRVSVASYTNFSNADADNSQRMRYIVSFNMKNINGSKLSLESYISFVHSNNNWNEVQDNLFNGLKIYNLSLRYDFNETTSLTFGRKINPNLSSVGAIDGLQFEKRFKSISVGAFVGSRPDYEDYSYSFKLLQYGAYVGHNYQKEKKSMQTSLAFIEQQNDGNTDRRFVILSAYQLLVKEGILFWFR